MLCTGYRQQKAERNKFTDQQALAYKRQHLPFISSAKVMKKSEQTPMLAKKLFNKSRLRSRLKSSQQTLASALPFRIFA